jgi:hypothetical protein
MRGIVRPRARDCLRGIGCGLGSKTSREEEDMVSSLFARQCNANYAMLRREREHEQRILYCRKRQVAADRRPPTAGPPSNSDESGCCNRDRGTLDPGPPGAGEGEKRCGSACFRCCQVPDLLLTHLPSYPLHFSLLYPDPDQKFPVGSIKQKPPSFLLGSLPSWKGS